MRFKQTFVSLVLAITMVAGAASHALAQAAVTFQAAAAKGMIDYGFEGMGGSSGASVRVKVKRGPNAPDVMPPITIPPGTILRSGNRGVQSMVVGGILGEDMGGGRYRPTSQIRVSGQSWVTMILSAFCAEFEKDNPSSSTTFSIEAPDPVLACVTRATEDASIASQQAAVWIVTDRITYKHMSEKFDVTPQDWATAQAAVQRCQGR